MTGFVSISHCAWSLAICGLAMVSTPAFAETGRTCMATDAQSHAACLSMIGVVRELAQGDGMADTTCVADDLATTVAVIDWIKLHPERADSDLAVLVREALITVDPCAQRALIPELPAADTIEGD